MATPATASPAGSFYQEQQHDCLNQRKDSTSLAGYNKSIENPFLGPEAPAVFTTTNNNDNHNDANTAMSFPSFGGFEDQDINGLFTAPIGDFDVDESWLGDGATVDSTVMYPQPSASKLSVGNSRFLSLIKLYRQAYLTAVTREEKHQILKTIFDELKSSGSGRFLSKRTVAGQEEWFEFSKHDALRKIRQWLVAGRKKARISRAVITNLNDSSSSMKESPLPRTASFVSVD